MTVNGLLEPSRTDLFGFHRPYAHPHPPSTDFVQVIKSLRSAAILGVSIKGQGLHPRGGPGDGRAEPAAVIFALSNPTDHAECTAVQFPPVRLGGKTFVTGQTNNLYIFPAIGLAIFATRATGVPGELFITAATAVAGQVTRAELGSGLLYPPQSNILQTKIATAVRVCEVIFDRGLAGVQRPADIRAFVEAQLYTPSATTLSDHDHAQGPFQALGENDGKQPGPDRHQDDRG